MSRPPARVAALAAIAALALLPPGAVARAAPAGADGAAAHTAPFARGADLSSLPQVEAAGGRFHDRGHEADAIAILRGHGFDHARLRLWHSPAGGACGLDATIAMARRLARAGMPLLLDLHYSDTWADPGHQSKPAAWARADFAALRDSVRDYTRDVIAAFRAAGVPPACVQLGNEIGNGLLWPDGRIARGADSAATWSMTAALLREAADGAREGAGEAPMRLMLHYENGGDARQAEAFFAHMEAERVPFDAIGLSYYPWWHGGLDALAATVARLRLRFQREVVVVECAYPFAPRGWDGNARTSSGRGRRCPRRIPRHRPASGRSFARWCGARGRREPRVSTTGSPRGSAHRGPARDGRTPRCSTPRGARCPRCGNSAARAERRAPAAAPQKVEPPGQRNRAVHLSPVLALTGLVEDLSQRSGGFNVAQALVLVAQD